MSILNHLVPGILNGALLNCANVRCSSSLPGGAEGSKLGLALDPKIVFNSKDSAMCISFGNARNPAHKYLVKFLKVLKPRTNKNVRSC